MHPHRVPGIKRLPPPRTPRRHDCIILRKPPIDFPEPVTAATDLRGKYFTDQKRFQFKFSLQLSIRYHAAAQNAEAIRCYCLAS